MSNGTLYDIDRALLNLMEAVDPETGEWAGDPEAWEQLSLARDEKLDHTACYVKDLKARAEAIAQEIRTLQARKKTLENKADWLAENLRRSLDGQTFESARCTVRFKKNPKSVVFTNEGDALSWAMESRPDLIRYGKPTLAKEELKRLLEAGEAIPGAEVVQTVRMEVK